MGGETLYTEEKNVQNEPIFLLDIKPIVKHFVILIPGLPPNENPGEAAEVAAAPNPPKAGGAAVEGAAAAAGAAAVAPPPKLKPPVAGAAEEQLF